MLLFSSTISIKPIPLHGVTYITCKQQTHFRSRFSPSEKFFGEREATTGNASAFRGLEVTKVKKKNKNDKTHKQVRTTVICADLEKKSPLIGIHNLFDFSLYNFSLNLLTSHKDQLVSFFTC